LLKALKQDCREQPLIFIDTYERLQAASEISQQKISSRYSHPHGVRPQFYDRLKKQMDNILIF